MLSPPPIPPVLLLVASLAAAAPRAQQATDAGGGHLVLVVTGNVRALSVVHAVARDSAWPGAPKGLRSQFALRILDAAGQELDRVPLDLSQFDQRPENAHLPDRVVRCRVLSSRVGLLVTAPRPAGAATWQLVRNKQVLGSIDRAALEALLRGGE